MRLLKHTKYSMSHTFEKISSSPQNCWAEFLGSCSFQRCLMSWNLSHCLQGIEIRIKSLKFPLKRPQRQQNLSTEEHPKRLWKKRLQTCQTHNTWTFPITISPEARSKRFVRGYRVTEGCDEHCAATTMEELSVNLSEDWQRNPLFWISAFL